MFEVHILNSFTKKVPVSCPLSSGPIPDHSRNTHRFHAMEPRLKLNCPIRPASSSYPRHSLPGKQQKNPITINSQSLHAVRNDLIMKLKLCSCILFYDFYFITTHSSCTLNFVFAFLALLSLNLALFGALKLHRNLDFLCAKSARPAALVSSGRIVTLAC